MGILQNKSGLSNLTGFAIVVIAIIIITVDANAQKKQPKPAAPTPAQSQVTEKEIRELSDAASQSRAKLIEASNTYRESLEKLLALQKQDEERAEAQVEKNQKLLEMGLIAKREVDESMQNLSEAHSKSAGTEKQIESIDQMIAEINAAEQLAQLPVATYRSTAMLIRYVGSSRWAMSDFTKIDAFFRLKFGKPLPVSALGQTETHTHLGFDHHDAIDVAVHPDSAEGQELINYLRSQGISFIAIRGAISGSATGAHIHIGPASKRIVIKS